MAKKSVSLCMIVKNEEDTIEQCLESVYAVVDEIIIGDTGSSDKTIDILKSFNKTEVFNIAWKDNFSEARNQILDKASGDWILILDADEVIAKKDLSKIKKIKESGQGKAYYFSVRHYMEDSRRPNFVFGSGEYKESKGSIGYVPTEKILFFENKKGVSYRGIIHETVLDSLKRLKIKPIRTSVVVHHYAYLKNVTDEKHKNEKFKKYVDLGKKQIALTPKIAKPYFDLSLLYLDHELYQNAVPYLEKAVDLNPHYLEASYNLGFAYLMTQHFSRAQELFENILEKFPRKNEIFVCLGRVYMKLKEYDTAIDYFNKALNINKDTVLAYYLTGIIRQSRGDMASALDNFTKVLKINPEFTIAYSAIGTVYFLVKDYERAKENFLKVKENISEFYEARYNLGLIYQIEKNYADAVQEYKRVLKYDTNHLSANYNLAYVYQHIGEHKLALKFYRKTLKLNPLSSVEINKRMQEIAEKPQR